jgi:hypothetical protein
MLVASVLAEAFEMRQGQKDLLKVEEVEVPVE